MKRDSKRAPWGKPLVFCLILSALFLAGCARIPKPRAPRAAVPPLQTREEVISLLLKDYGKLNSMKASGEIEFLQIEEEQWKQASILLFAQRPDKVRARAYRLLSPTLFEFVSNGRDCWLSIPSEHAVYYDDRCGLFQEGEDRLVISSDIIIAALMVVSDFDSILHSEGSVSKEHGLLRLSLMNDNGLRRELLIDPVTGLVARQLFTNQAGAVEAEIQYLEHAARGDVVAPVEIEVALPQAKAGLRLHLTDVEVDPNLPPDAFSFSPPQNSRIENLDSAR